MQWPVVINMNKVLIFIFILSSTIGFSQDSLIPKIEWNGTSENENQYVALLRLRDRNSLIVKVAYTGYWLKGISGKYIVFQNDGKIKRYNVFQPTDSDSKTKIKRKRVRKKDFEYYRAHLRNCVYENKLSIIKSKLNITEKPGAKKGTMITKVISDGANYHFGIYQGKNYIAYGSYEPESFIEDEFPGYQERKKLVDLMSGFESLMEKY
ncbi:hypothetical protein [Dokdonia sp. R86516]|uniref:hypothetical protein n=1 Tax=Dokdonia sp. R86516 TaxID=3093856 RepID=UPI0037C61A8B